jgi:HSP20 family protein
MNAIIRRRPSRILRWPETYFYPTLMGEFDDLARRVWGGEEGFFGRELHAGLEMYEDKDDLVIKTDLPGVTTEDLDVSLDDGVLTIKAEKNHEEVSEDATYYARERSYGKYHRSLRLPFQVAGDQVTATLEHGVLEMRLPKAEEAKPKQIEVKEAEATEPETKES